MPDDAPLLRQWTLLRLLSGRLRGGAVKELAREANVSEKTIRRDLDLFRSVGFPIREEVVEHGKKCWRIDSRWNEQPLSFTFDEALALYLGRRFLEPLGGSVFADVTRSAFAKIRAVLDKVALAHVEKMMGRIERTHSWTSGYAPKGELIERLLIAIEDSKAAHITYQSAAATEPATRDVYPLALVVHRSSLYLIAHSPEHGKPRTYKMDRLTDVEVSELKVEPPGEFSVEGYLQKSFGIFQGEGDVRVVVKFAARVARYVSESTWHVSQKLTPAADGSVLAEFQLSTTEEIKHWILSFGAAAEVLEPDVLRAELADEATRMLGAYTANPTLRTNNR